MSSEVPCYICGEVRKPTRDHVFPRCLFVSPLPQEMLTAPACEACQQSIQPDEEVFRNFVAAGSYADETARALWEGKVAGSFANSPALRATFVDSIKTLEWKSPRRDHHWGSHRRRGRQEPNGECIAAHASRVSRGLPMCSSHPR